MFLFVEFHEKNVLRTSENWRLALKQHARSMSHCVLHLFLNSKQRTKLETVNSDGIYFRSSSPLDPPIAFAWLSETVGHCTALTDWVLHPFAQQ